MIALTYGCNERRAGREFAINAAQLLQSRTHSQSVVIDPTSVPMLRFALQRLQPSLCLYFHTTPNIQRNLCILSERRLAVIVHNGADLQPTAALAKRMKGIARAPARMASEKGGTPRMVHNDACER